MPILPQLFLYRYFLLEISITSLDEMKALYKAETGAALGALSYVFICEIDKINKLFNIPDLRNWAYVRKMQIS